jgi:argininosuccinate lyase
LAEEKALDISELSLDDLQSIDKRIGADVSDLLYNRASMNARTSEGGTASERVREMVVAMESWIREEKEV